MCTVRNVSKKHMVYSRQLSMITDILTKSFLTKLHNIFSVGLCCTKQNSPGKKKDYNFGNLSLSKVLLTNVPSVTFESNLDNENEGSCCHAGICDEPQAKTGRTFILLGKKCTCFLLLGIPLQAIFYNSLNIICADPLIF